jgi:atypical dual specificity phosphatase
MPSTSKTFSKHKYLKHFSWIDETNVAGMAYPVSQKTLDVLEKLNVGLIVTLTEQPIPFSKGTIKNLHIQIKNDSIPTFDQLDLILQAIADINKQGKAAVVHCRAGHGRTGTILACWLIAKYGIRGDKAIKRIRHLRPKSIQTRCQELFIKAFYKRILEKTLTYNL